MADLNDWYAMGSGGATAPVNNVAPAQGPQQIQGTASFAGGVTSSHLTLGLTILLFVGALVLLHLE